MKWGFFFVSDDIFYLPFAVVKNQLREHFSIIFYTIWKINDGWLISNQNLCVINSIAFSNKQLKLNNTQERLSDLETTLKTKTQLSKELQKNIGKIWQQVSKRETADTGWVTLRALARETHYELFVLRN